MNQRSSDQARDLVDAVTNDLGGVIQSRTAAVEQRLERVLEAMAAERLGTQHFASLTGYGHGDQGREVIDRIFARVRTFAMRASKRHARDADA